MNDSTQPIRALVTGGAGFIGSRIVSTLLARGAEVTVIDDFSTGERNRLSADVEVITADIADRETIDMVIGARPSLVIHAAAQASVTKSFEDPGRDRAVNLDGTRHVLEGALAGGVERFIFLSSGGAVYGTTSLGHETDVPAPETYYGIHKLAAEGYVSLAGIPSAILRLANVYGAGQRSTLEGGVVAIFAEQLLGGKPVTVYGNGEQRRDFIFVEDVVDLVMRAAQAGPSGTWNAGSARSTSVLELLGQMQGVFGTAVSVQHAAARVGDVPVSRLSSAKARRDLNWRPRHSLAAGLRQMALDLEAE